MEVGGGEAPQPQVGGPRGPTSGTSGSYDEKYCCSSSNRRFHISQQSSAKYELIAVSTTVSILNVASLNPIDPPAVLGLVHSAWGVDTCGST